MAGLTVAVMGVPQAMAYAMIADLPPIYGLYTSIIPCVIAAVFGSSNHLITGPTNATCMVLFSITASLPKNYPVEPLEVILALGLLTGLFQFLFGALKLGGIVRYVSNSVVVGFTAGAGILIAVNQLKSFLGVKLDAGEGANFLSTLLATVRHFTETNPYALTVGVITVAIVLGLRRWRPRLPGSLIALIFVSALGLVLGWIDPAMGARRVAIVRDIQEISPSWDIFAMPKSLLPPNIALFRDLAAGALDLTILGLVESVSISRSIAASSGQRLDFTKEFKAQGLAKFVGAFFHCFPASGSFTRSAVCYQSGGHTRLAAIYSAIFTAVVLFAFGPFANYIPQPALAGVILIIAVTMVERNRLIRTLRSGTNSQVVVGGTLLATLVLPLEMAVFAGVALSIVILLRITGKPDLTQLVQHADYGFEEVPFNRAAPSPVAIINLEGDLYFAAAEDLDYELLQALRPETRVVVLRMKRLRAVGSSAMGMLDHFHQLLHERGIHLIVCGVEQKMTDVLTGSGVRDRLGEQNIFYADNRLFQSTELALARAMSIVEMQRARGEASSAAAQKQALTEMTAADIMQRRCLRFGSKHQTREAMWLISQFQQKMKTDHPQTVFLQDEEGRLCGEVSPRSILKQLAATVPDERTDAIEDAELARLIEPRLYQSISSFSLSDPVSLRDRTPLVNVFSRAARHRFRSMPVSDEHGRLVGVLDELAILRGLTELLRTAQKAVEGPPTPPPGPPDGPEDGRQPLTNIGIPIQ